jgi:3-dehydroquinate synthase
LIKTIPVKLKNNSYSIIVGSQILPRLGATLKSLNIGKNVVIVTNPMIKKLWGKNVITSLKKRGYVAYVIEVPDGERSKSLRMAIHLLDRIAHYDAMKDVSLIALGGGVIGDLAGFVAAVYKRGIPYVQIPTTFLAQIDSAIGGKTAVDLSIGKNLVGAFYQPRVVFSDVAVLKTLSQRQLRNGLAEAVKYGVIDDEKLFETIERQVPLLLKGDLNALEHIVRESSRIKANVVMADEKETKGIRTILNFGHTLGHAIEAAGHYRVYHHGEAIALGMRIASRMSVLLKMFSPDEDDRLNTLLTRIGLPSRIQQVRLVDILRIMQYDKKFKSGRNRFVLAQRIGKVKVVEGVQRSVIREALADYR